MSLHTAMCCKRIQMEENFEMLGSDGKHETTLNRCKSVNYVTFLAYG